MQGRMDGKERDRIQFLGRKGLKEVNQNGYNDSDT